MPEAAGEGFPQFPVRQQRWVTSVIVNSVSSGAEPTNWRQVEQMETYLLTAVTLHLMNFFMAHTHLRHVVMAVANRRSAFRSGYEARADSSS
jgi:hypothetical protein